MNVSVRSKSNGPDQMLQYLCYGTTPFLRSKIGYCVTLSYSITVATTMRMITLQQCYRQSESRMTSYVHAGNEVTA